MLEIIEKRYYIIINNNINNHCMQPQQEENKISFHIQYQLKMPIYSV